MINIEIEKELYGSFGEMKLSVNLNIKKGEFLSLTGDSGSGKTTLLRILAGLEEAKGKISVDNEIWLDTKVNIPPQKRGIGFVFQDYALFSNMSVEENLLFVTKDRQLANHLLDITQLSQLKKQFPHRLSGGQKQRVSLCRAMMNRPKLLLMDEPLSALDITMRKKLQLEILELHKEFGTTTIVVSHDITEIYKLSSRVIILNQGEVISDGSPKNVLLQTRGLPKFSLEGELLEVTKINDIYIAIISIAHQLVEVIIGEDEAKSLSIGDMVTLSTNGILK